MKVVICGSINNRISMLRVARQLEAEGHEVVVPADAPGDDARSESPPTESQRKRDYDLIRRHWKHITDADVVVVLPGGRDRPDGHIGQNTFLEIGFAHVLGKPVVLTEEPNAESMTAELLALDWSLVQGDLKQYLSLGTRGPTYDADSHAAR